MENSQGQTLSLIKKSREQRCDKDDDISLLDILLSCCDCAANDEKEITKPPFPFKEMNVQATVESNKETEDDVILPEIYIRNDEKDVIKFTRAGVVEYINNILNSDFLLNYNKEDLKIYSKNGSEINKEKVLIKADKTIKKSSFKSVIPTLEEFCDSITNTEILKTYDSSLQSTEILKELGEDIVIRKCVTNKLLKIISEREILEKTYKFFENNTFYLLSTSIPDELYPPTQDKIRATNYMSLFRIKEDKDNFYFNFANQVDMKMYIPQPFIIMGMPSKVNEMVDGIIKYFNEKKTEEK